MKILVYLYMIAGFLWFAGAIFAWQRGKFHLVIIAVVMVLIQMIRFDVELDKIRRDK